MSDSWKGLMVGAATGAALSIAVDGVGRASGKGKPGRSPTARTADSFRTGRPEAVKKLKEVGRKSAGLLKETAEVVREKDLPTKARDTAHRMAESERSRKLKERFAQATERAAEATERRIVETTRRIAPH